jgi:hypothetical protein
MSNSSAVGSKPHDQALPSNNGLYQLFPLSRQDTLSGRAPQHRSSTNWVAFGKTVVPICLGLAGIGLLAISILHDGRVLSKAWVPFALGVTFQITLQVIPLLQNRGPDNSGWRTLDHGKDKIIQYSRIFFDDLLQLYLAKSEPRVHQ